MSSSSHWKVSVEATAFLKNQFPPPDLPEVALAGRSNVGKSTLVNALLGTKLAHVAAAPGKTRSINFYRVDVATKETSPPDPMGDSPLSINGEGEISFRVVDLPGYGYASRSKGEQKEWSRLILSYVEARANLVLILHLVDLRHGLLENDRQLQEWLSDSKKNFAVAFTKADKISRGSRKGLMQKYINEGLRSFEMPVITSGTTRDGIAELRALIEKAVC